MKPSVVCSELVGTETHRRRLRNRASPPKSWRGRFINVCAVIFVFVSNTYAHAAGTRPPHMTGDQFIAELRGGPQSHRLFDKSYALGYLAGVVDAAQGRNWCVPGRLKSSVADGQVLDELARRPTNSMPGTAAAVLLEEYKAKFPSAPGNCAFKPRLTGNEFAVWVIGNRGKSSKEKLNPGVEVSERERFADGYIGGVIDATQGTDWCAPPRLKPSELDAIGYWSLVDRPAGSMPGNAATLLHKHFIAKYPCRPQP